LFPPLGFLPGRYFCLPEINEAGPEQNSDNRQTGRYGKDAQPNEKQDRGRKPPAILIFMKLSNMMSPDLAGWAADSVFSERKHHGMPDFKGFLSL
jgi:hypothetical protein